jgi:hypothetical protein
MNSKIEDGKGFPNRSVDRAVVREALATECRTDVPAATSGDMKRIACMNTKSGNKYWLKIGIPLVLVSIFVVSIYMYTGANPREPDEFRGVRWGTPLDQLPGLHVLAEEGDYKFCENRYDKMAFEQVEVEKIVYGFYKNRFYNAMIYFRTSGKLAELKKALTRRHGDPIQPEQAENKYFWNGHTVDILMTFDAGSDAGRISYSFKPIQLESELKR